MTVFVKNTKFAPRQRARLVGVGATFVGKASEIVVKTPTKRRGCFCNGGRASAHRRHRCLVLEDTDESLTHPMLPEMIDAQAQAQAQAPAPEMAQAKAQEMAQAKATAGGRLLILQLGATNDASGTPDPDVLARCPITVALHRAAVAAGRAVTVRSRQSVSQPANQSLPYCQRAHGSLALTCQGTAGISGPN